MENDTDGDEHVTQPPMSYEQLTDAELLGEMEAKQADLELLEARLESQRPNLILSTWLMVVGDLLVVTSLWFTVVPVPTASRYVPTIAAFLAVLSGFAAYAAHRKWAAEVERRRALTAALREVGYLDKVAAQVIEEMRTSSELAHAQR